MSASTETFDSLHSFLSRELFVMSRITHSKDTSSDDGEGKESFHGVGAQWAHLPFRSIFYSGMVRLGKQKNVVKYKLSN